MTLWLRELEQRVVQATTRMASISTRIIDGRQALMARLDAELRKVDDGQLTREHTINSTVHENVVNAFRRDRFADLTRREQRYAARQFGTVTPSQMQAFLMAQPENWPAFTVECLRRFEDLHQVSDVAGYARLFALSPPSAIVVDGPRRLQDLIDVSGPTLIAKSVSGVNLVEARDTLARRGFDPSWTFTAISLAMVARMRVDQGQGFATAWNAVASDLVLEAMLLPALTDRRLSWFSQGQRSPRIRGATAASAVFVGTLIRAAYSTGVDGRSWNDFTERLIASEFKDPRIPPESPGWTKVRRFDEASYRKFLEMLITEDLEMFFQHAMVDQRRKKFWTRYTGSVRRTICVLERTKHEQLKRLLDSSDKKLAASLSRARQFKRTGGAQAFCLYFDNAVIVEFSETGNAAHIYDRKVFQEAFESKIESNACMDHASLKSRKLAGERRILHQATDWESDAAQTLAKLGIYADRAKA